MRTLITGASSGLGEGMAREFARPRARPRARRPAPRPSRGPARRARAHRGPDRRRRPRRRRPRRGLHDRSGRCATSSAGSTAWSSTPGWARARRSAPDASTSTSPPARTNFVAALAQCEAAMEIFRAQSSGHLVVVSSVAADRGLPGAQTDVRGDEGGALAPRRGHPRRRRRTPRSGVTTLAPGYIRTDLNGGMTMPLSPSTPRRAAAPWSRRSRRRRAFAYVPTWPWAVLGRVLRVMPTPILRRVT